MYVHRKTTGEAYYVGKGSGLRAWVKDKRSKYWQAVSAKYGCIVDIVDKDLSEHVAFELEEFLISLYGIKSDGGTLTNLTRGGEGSSGYKPSRETRRKTSLKTKGMLNPASDKTVYTFMNCTTKEEFTGTRQDFTAYTGVCVIALFSAKDLVAKGWCRKERFLDAMNSHCDFNIYLFQHISGEIIESTRIDFKDKTGVCPNDMFRVRDNKCGSSKGWFVPKHSLSRPYTEKPQSIKPACSSTVYIFKHITGETITATRRDFKNQTDVDPRQLFKSEKWRYKSVAGWALSTTL